MDRHELHEHTAAADEEMRRYPNALQVSQRRMRADIQSAKEQPLDRIGPKATRRQTDGMNHDQVHLGIDGSCVGMRRRAPHGAGMPSVGTDSGPRLRAPDAGGPDRHCMPRRCMR